MTMVLSVLISRVRISSIHRKSRYNEQLDLNSFCQKSFLPLFIVNIVMKTRARIKFSLFRSACDKEISQRRIKPKRDVIVPSLCVLNGLCEEQVTGCGGYLSSKTRTVFYVYEHCDTSKPDGHRSFHFAFHTSSSIFSIFSMRSFLVDEYPSLPELRSARSFSAKSFSPIRFYEFRLDPFKITFSAGNVAKKILNQLPVQLPKADSPFTYYIRRWGSSSRIVSLGKILIHFVLALRCVSLRKHRRRHSAFHNLHFSKSLSYFAP